MPNIPVPLHLIQSALDDPEEKGWIESFFAHMDKVHKKYKAKIPKWCYAPTHYMVKKFGADPNSSQSAVQTQVIKLSLALYLGTWRLTKRVYTFDSTIFEMVWNTPLRANEPIPSYLLKHLPVRAVWIECPPDHKLQGFLACCDYGSAGESLAIYGFERETLRPLSAQIYFDEQVTLDAELDRQRSAFTHEPIFDAVTKPLIKGMVSCLLYLCSDKPDIVVPDNYQPLKIRKTALGSIPIPVDQVEEWLVGSRLGPKFRREDEGETRPKARGTGEVQFQGPPTGRRLRRHIREAHWHLYWTGKGRNKPVLKWLAEIKVNHQWEESDLLPITRSTVE
jgi:hypothetical protein